MKTVEQQRLRLEMNAKKDGVWKTSSLMPMSSLKTTTIWCNFKTKFGHGWPHLSEPLDLVWQPKVIVGRNLSRNVSAVICYG